MRSKSSICIQKNISRNMSKEHGPKTIKLGFSYKEILKRKAEQGDKRAKQILKELGPNRGVFDNYNG